MAHFKINTANIPQVMSTITTDTTTVPWSIGVCVVLRESLSLSPSHFPFPLFASSSPSLFSLNSAVNCYPPFLTLFKHRRYHIA